MNLYKMHFFFLFKVCFYCDLNDSNSTEALKDNTCDG